MHRKQTNSLLDNGRFYVVALSVALSLLIFCVLRIVIVDSRLRGIKLQQIYGLLSILYWYVVLLMSATAKVLPVKPWIKMLLFLRRPLGVMVAYFASLHTFIAFFDQLGGWSGIGQLPTIFQWSLALGTIALTVLLIMSVLSIDKIVSVTKFKHWKWLQRASYAAGVLVLVHMWTIGTHVAPNGIQLTAFFMLVLLFGFEVLRVRAGMINKGRGSGLAAILSISLFSLLVAGLLALRLGVPSMTNSHAIESAGTEIHAH